MSRRFYLTEDMTNFYLFIQDSLELPFSELFFSAVSLWNLDILHLTFSHAEFSPFRVKC